MRAREGVIAAVAVLALAGSAQAQISIDFTGLPTGPVHGQTIQGVTFEYFVNGLPNQYGKVSGGVGCFVYVCNEGLEGNTTNATLVMSFTDPVSFFQFGLLGQSWTPSSVLVSLYDPYGSALGIQNFGLAAATGSPLAQGQFQWNGTALGKIEIDLDSNPAYMPRFTLDNIYADLSPEDWDGPTTLDGVDPATTVTPEPISMLLLGTGLAGIGGVARRRRRFEDSD